MYHLSDSGADQNGEGASTGDYVETDPTGRYGRLDEVLGKGAVKTVYKAIDEVLGIEVAWNQARICHILRSPQELQRLYSEVHLLSTLNHPCIIRFYTSWIDTTRMTFNFITEMFTSGNLREYRKKYKRLDIRVIKSWARQILEGLCYLHSHDPPVIHRDLKCDNIFVNGHLGQVKIGDLGLAAILGRSRSAHTIIGTPEFMAPELYEEHYNELVDVYSFGMCVLEMFTSEYPYSECNNRVQIYKRVTAGKLPRAFYQIENMEAQRFIGKCLQTASKRLSAKDLLLDPFLSPDDDTHQILTTFNVRAENPKPFLNDLGIDKLYLDHVSPRTNMTITGKLNPEDNTIFLKVQLSEGEGSVRNVYFPFDVLSDTPIGVATEMVKELEIDDWDPREIACMIDHEISTLAPNWRRYEPYHIYNHQEDEYADDISSCSSSLSDMHLTPRTWLRNEYEQKESPDANGTLGDKSSRKEPSRYKLRRNRSLLDMQTQLLHQSLVEEVSKRRLSKTVSSVESIGYQSPYKNSGKMPVVGKQYSCLVKPNMIGNDKK